MDIASWSKAGLGKERAFGEQFYEVRE